MKLSFDWLSDYVDLSGISAQEVADKLTMGAFEVEEVRKVGADIEGPVVLGQIMEIMPHPNADKIRLTRTRVAPDQAPLEIVCGAGNIEVGQYIPVALPGAKVINRKDGTALAIKAAPIRGVQSNGMLCSPPELGMVEPGTETPEASGILILDKSYGDVGADIKQIFHLYPDYILIVGPRSNRGDALSVIGLAREVAALTKRGLKKPDWSLASPEDAGLDFTVSIENLDDCPFFTIRQIEGVKVGPSPREIARRLEAVGIRSINNVVDITNYVMHEYGQPLHAYDMAKLSSPALAVRRAGKEERIVTIDGKERTLSDEILVIANPGSASGSVGVSPASHPGSVGVSPASKAVGVAGVMGGADSEITDGTTSIALEAASFTPSRVRRGGRLLGLSSESSLRFERGVDVGTTTAASDRATFLLAKHCTDLGKAKIGKLVRAGTDATSESRVNLRMSQLKRFLGVEFNPPQVVELLTPLGFDARQVGNDQVEALVPSFRQADVKREIDLLEEVCRIWGYENLPVSMPRCAASAQLRDDTESATRECLVGCGLSEAWISSLTGDESGSINGKYISQAEDKLIRVLNPLSEEHQALRQSLLPGLVKAAVYNQGRGRKDIWLFEIGRTYNRVSPGEDMLGTGVEEQLQVAGLLIGDRRLGLWQSNKTDGKLDFYAAKGTVENLFSHLSIATKNIQFDNTESCAIMHPTRSASIIFARGKRRKARNNKNGDQQANQQTINKDGDQIIGQIGQLHPAFADSVGLRQEAYVFEIKLEVLRALRKGKKFAEMPSTPAVVRDITADVKDEIAHAAVEACIYASAGVALESVTLVSVYQLGTGERSLSYRLSYQDMNRTLTNDEVDTSLAKVREALGRDCLAKFRA